MDQNLEKRRDLFVGNLSLFTDEQKLRQRFSKYGAIDDVRIMIHSDTKKSRRFGFITFADSASLEAVLNGPNAESLDGKVLQCHIATRRKGSSQDKVSDGGLASCSPSKRKVFVGGLSQETSNEDLRRHFAAFGPIETVNIPLDETSGRHRGFSFVTFELETSAVDACATKIQEIKGRKVEVKKANPKKTTLAPAPPNNNSLLGLPPIQYLVNWPQQLVMPSHHSFKPRSNRFMPYPYPTFPVSTAPTQAATASNHLSTTIPVIGWPAPSQHASTSSYVIDHQRQPLFTIPEYPYFVTSQNPSAGDPTSPFQP